MKKQSITPWSIGRIVTLVYGLIMLFLIIALTIMLVFVVQPRNDLPVLIMLTMILGAGYFVGIWATVRALKRSNWKQYKILPYSPLN